MGKGEDITVITMPWFSQCAFIFEPAFTYCIGVTMHKQFGAENQRKSLHSVKNKKIVKSVKFKIYIWKCKYQI